MLYTVKAGGQRFIGESGTMNVFLVTAKRELITLSLGSILSGVTRDRVLALAEEYGLDPVERTVPLAELLAELLAECADGSVTELFAAGTAAVLTPITCLRTDAGTVQVGHGGQGEHGWMHSVD